MFGLKSANKLIKHGFLAVCLRKQPKMQSRLYIFLQYYLEDFKIHIIFASIKKELEQKHSIYVIVLNLPKQNKQ